MSQILSSQLKFLSKAKQPLLLAISIVIAGSANGAESCQRMNVLMEQARSKLVSGTAKTIDDSALQTFIGAEKCTLSRSLSGGNAYHCAWKYPYRDDAANAAFETFNQMMRECFETSAEVVKDEGVNHPDTYYQRQYILDPLAVSISIKDKSQLHETYVFIGIQRARNK